MPDPLAAEPEAPASLPAWLAEHADSAPSEPWLIFREALDWGWLSYAQVADQVARIARSLELGQPHAHSGRLDPDIIALDLAIQACGGLAISEPPRTEEIARHHPAGDGDLPPPRSRLSRWQAEAIDLAHAREGRVQVTRGEAGEIWDMESLLARADALSSVIESAFREAGKAGRPIALACGSLRDPGVRALFAWTLVHGAVIALEPDIDLAAQAVTWVRPHVAVVPADQLDAVRAAVDGQKPKWRRLRWLGSASDVPDCR